MLAWAQRKIGTKGRRRRWTARDSSRVCQWKKKRSQEFVCSMATRRDEKAVGGLTPERESAEVQKKPCKSRGKEWGSWQKYQAICGPPRRRTLRACKEKEAASSR